VTRLDDIDFARPVDIPQSVIVGMEKLDVDMDDLAGQFNAGSVQTNRTLNDTVGGLKLIAGASNAVQEFDIRLWIETWAEPALAQVVRLEQYYESDEIILGLCGQRAQLWQKHGVSRITDDLMDRQVTIRINAGLGVGDPQQRLAKFRDATAVAAPLLAQSPDFQSGKIKLNTAEIMNECFGAVGYRDGGKRFISESPPDPAQAQQQQMQQGLALQNMLAEIALKRARAQHAQGQAANAQALGMAAIAGAHTDHARLMHDARNAAFDHAHQVHDRLLAAHEQGHRHAMQVADAHDARMAKNGGVVNGGMVNSEETPLTAHHSPLTSSEASPETDVLQQLIAALAAPRPPIEFTRDPTTGRISGARYLHPQLPPPE
jgi:hypothetical protein